MAATTTMAMAATRAILSRESEGEETGALGLNKGGWREEGRPLIHRERAGMAATGPGAPWDGRHDPPASSSEVGDEVEVGCPMLLDGPKCTMALEPINT